MAEAIGTIYPTLIPEYDESADIQAALKLYHYGTLETVSDNGDIVGESVVGYIAELQSQVDFLEARKLGSEYLSTVPVGKENGFIWVDASSEGIVTTFYPTVYYTSTPPTDQITTGVVWVDTSTDAKLIKVWDGYANSWITVNEVSSLVTTKGDILGTSVSGDLTRLPVGVNGYVLSADSSKSLGIDWKQLPEAEDKLAFIMGVY